MRIGTLLYVENDLTDNDLTFNGIYLPEELESRLKIVKPVTDVLFSVPNNYSGKLKNSKSVLKRTGDDVTFWKSCFSKTKLDHIIKIFADSPFLDTKIISEMIEVHIKYLAEFTYSENLPSGYSCEIMSKGLLESIPDSDERMLPLSDVIKSNLNQFDVELYYKDPDIRDKRIAFRSGNQRERKILEAIFNKSGIPAYSKIENLINKNPHILFVAPSYLEVELTGRCDLDCIFCYRNTLKEIHPDMSLDIYKKILSDMKAFELPYSICFGGSGEPLMHDKFYEIMDLSLKEKLVNTIVIETNGIYADNNFLNYVKNTKDPGIKIIFNINGMDAGSYKTIHNGDHFKTVSRNILAIKEAVDFEDNIFIQILKINETEKFIDNYYDFWEQYKIPIILQKQNTYLSKIEDRRFSDLTPLERTPCWHLQRDLYVLASGIIGFCQQDVDGEYSGTDINNESLSEIWEKSKTRFINDFEEKYPDNPDCKSCDEWYTFNL